MEEGEGGTKVGSNGEKEKNRGKDGGERLREGGMEEERRDGEGRKESKREKECI